MPCTKFRKSAIAVTATLLATSTAFAAAPAAVTNGNDSGDGSLRAALASGAGLIQIDSSVSTIMIEDTLIYAGTKPLRLLGVYQTIQAVDGDDDFTLLEVTNGANLEIRHLRFEGNGDFDLNNPGDGKGIYVKVPEDATGVVHLKLMEVNVSGVAAHGVHVSDCTLGDDCGSGGGGGGEGSQASIHVELESVNVRNVGHGKFDADGVRVDERNDGDIIFYSQSSSFYNVGADGVELDEGNNGDVYLSVKGNYFEVNGGYCLDAPLDIDQPCVEDDDGELVLDLDDGFDVDEAGAGSILGLIADSLVDDNLDEGLDFDEEDEGGMNLDIYRVYVMGNGDEGIKLSAAHGGDINVDLRLLDVENNGDDGIQVENEDGDGETHVRFFHSRSTNNQKKGLTVTQENTTSLGTLQEAGDLDVDEIELENVQEL